MDALALIRRMNQHRGWVNRGLLDAAGGLNDEQLHAPQPIGQGSVWKSLLHMLAAEYVWLGALEGDDSTLFPGDVRGKIPGNQLAEGGPKTLAEIRERWAELDQRWQAYVDGLTVASLDETVYRITSLGGGIRFGTRRSDVLLHVFMHAHYTAAQTINMLRHAGVEKLPETMVISLARSETTPA